MAGTNAEDYARAYYDDPHLGSYGDYSWDTPHWQEFFTMVADRIVGLTEARTALDVGCAKGLLVQALATRGVDARGFDISDYAVDGAHPDVRARLWVGSATDPIDGRYDLITCVEVLEHLSPDDAQKAIDTMCAATDRILFSSSPGHHEEPTHINTHPTADWVAWFAERGFYRHDAADATFLAPWAVLFERADLSKHAIVERYERLVAPLRTEAQDKKAALLEMHRKLSQFESAADASVASAELIKQWEAEVLEARHKLLTSRDHIVGIEATSGRLRRENAQLRKRIRRLRDQLEKSRESLRAERARVQELEQANASFVRRVARKLRGPR